MKILDFVDEVTKRELTAHVHYIFIECIRIFHKVTFRLCSHFVFWHNFSEYVHRLDNFKSNSLDL